MLVTEHGYAALPQIRRWGSQELLATLQHAATLTGDSQSLQVPSGSAVPRPKQVFALVYSEHVGPTPVTGELHVHEVVFVEAS